MNENQETAKSVLKVRSPFHALLFAQGRADAKPAADIFHTYRRGDTSSCRQSDTVLPPCTGRAAAAGSCLETGRRWPNSPARSGWRPGTCADWHERGRPCSPSSPLPSRHCTAVLCCQSPELHTTEHTNKTRSKLQQQ